MTKLQMHKMSVANQREMSGILLHTAVASVWRQDTTEAPKHPQFTTLSVSQELFHDALRLKEIPKNSIY